MENPNGIDVRFARVLVIGWQFEFANFECMGLKISRRNPGELGGAGLC